MTAAFYSALVLASGGGGGVDEMGFDPHAFKLTLWTFVTFVVVLAILWNFAWGPILAALAERSAKIKSDIEGAEAGRAEANALKADYQAKLDHARAEVVGIVEEGKRDAVALKETILAAAKDEATAVKARAEREVALARAAAYEEGWDATAKLSAELAGRLIGRELKASDHTKLIAEVVDRYKSSVAKQVS